MKAAKGEMITIRVEPELMELIIAWGKDAEGLPSKAEVVRQMVEYAAKHRSERK